MARLWRRPSGRKRAADAKRWKVEGMAAECISIAERAVTLDELASLTRVDEISVSQAAGNSAPTFERTCVKVAAVAERRGCAPNPRTEPLASEPPNIAGAVIPSLSIVV